MKPHVLDFITVSLEAMDKHIEVLDRHHVTEKQKVIVIIKMCNDSGDNFIVIFHKIDLVPDLCDMLFLIITLMNLVHTCLFQKLFFTVYFGNKDKNALTLL